MNIGYIGVSSALAFSAMGSAVGIGIAGMFAIGAWKKCYLQNKKASFMLLAFVGSPLTQTIYGLILMTTLSGKLAESDPFSILAHGILGGIAIGLAGIFQGKAAGVACDALAETDKGFASNIMVIGLVETVSLFTMVFFLI